MSDAQTVDVAKMDDAELRKVIEEDAGGEPVEEQNQSTEAPAQEEKKAEEKPEQQSTPEKEELEKLRRLASEQKKLIDRQGNEVGELRKFRDSLMERKKALEAKAVERFVENPSQFLDERDQLNRQIEETNRHEEQAQVRQLMSRNQEYAGTHMPDLKDHLDSMAEIFRASGDTEQNIQAFMRNPFMFPSPFVHSIYLAAKERRSRAAVEQEMERLKKQAEDTLKKVDQAARSKPLTNQSGGAQSGKKSVSASQLPQLSDEELRELIKQGSL